MGTDEKKTDLSVLLDSDSVTECELFESQLRLEDCEISHTVWGICVRFSSGRVVRIPDLCMRHSDAEILKKRLDGASLGEEFLPDIIDDYLGEMYGLHSDAAWEPHGYAKKEA